MLQWLFFPTRYTPQEHIPHVCRVCSVGPVCLLGPPPKHVRARSLGTAVCPVCSKLTKKAIASSQPPNIFSFLRFLCCVFFYLTIAFHYVDISNLVFSSLFLPSVCTASFIPISSYFCTVHAYTLDYRSPWTQLANAVPARARRMNRARIRIRSRLQ